MKRLGSVRKELFALEKNLPNLNVRLGGEKEH